MAGRPRKPYKLRALEGGRGKSRPLMPDLEAPADPLEAPAGLSKAERAEWERHALYLRRLRVESCVDAGLFEGMIRALCRARAADRVIARKGLTMSTPANGVTKRPEVGISADQWRLYNQLAAQFGLSPVARAKLGKGGDAPERAGDVPPELASADAGGA